MCVLKTHMKCVLERQGTSRVFFTYFDVLFTPVINIAKHLSSVLYYSSGGLVFKQEFKAKVELIYGRLFNYRKNLSKLINYYYQNNDTMLPFVPSVPFVLFSWIIIEFENVINIVGLTENIPWFREINRENLNYAKMSTTRVSKYK